MAYEVPTAAALIARYPAFAAVAVETIDIHIADAAASGVDTSWIEGDYAPAIAALAAHNMALLGIGDHGELAGFAQAGVTRIRTGNFDAGFSERKVGAASSGGFDATTYGQRYKVLLRRSKGGPRLVGGGPVSDDWAALAQQNNGGVVPWAP
jgi:hypothetical protein